MTITNWLPSASYTVWEYRPKLPSPRSSRDSHLNGGASTTLYDAATGCFGAIRVENVRVATTALLWFVVPLGTVPLSTAVAAILPPSGTYQSGGKPGFVTQWTRRRS